MIRVVLVLLAVVVAILAFVFHRPWLYGAAGVSLLGALGLLGNHLWTAYRRQQETEPPSSSSAGRTNASMGVSDVQPQDREGGSNGSSSPDPGSSSPDPETGRSATPTGKERGDDGIAVASPNSPSATEEGAQTDTAQRSSPATAAVASEGRPVLGPFLESLRAALTAQTACLLVQEEVVLEYRIAALASAQTDVQRSGTFETQSPLLTATMSRQSVTVRQVDGEKDRADLGYYDTPPAIDQVAVAPVPQPDSSSSAFLMVDATAEVDLAASRARALLERFADTASMLRDEEGADDTAHQASPTRAPAEKSTEEASSASPDASGEQSGRPRPRREIIAEEMEAADAGNDALALVLVHLNRAESIARRGEEAVATAEQFLRTRLEHFAPGQRVERFGELTYGLFPRRDVEAVEEWVAELQEAMDQETGELEGGVSVGVAVRQPRHDPEDLRADATKALQEAYETGTSTIVE